MGNHPKTITTINSLILNKKMLRLKMGLNYIRMRFDVEILEKFDAMVCKWTIQTIYKVQKLWESILDY